MLRATLLISDRLNPSFAKNSSFSAVTVDLDLSPVSNDIPTKSRPTGSKETLTRLGQSRRDCRRSGKNTVASRVAHRRNT